MNGAQLHLLVNHLPLFATLFGALMLPLALWKRSGPAILIVAVALIAIGGLGLVAATVSGEEAEHIAEELPGVAAADIEQHEEAASLTLWIGLVVAALALWLLYSTSQRAWQPYRPLLIVTVLAGLLSFGLIAWTAHTGGLVRHPETSGNWSPTKSATERGEANHETDPATPDDED